MSSLSLPIARPVIAFTPLCPAGQAIAEEQGSLAVVVDGLATDLYLHILRCPICSSMKALFSKETSHA